MVEAHLMGHLEALLFAAAEPLAVDKIASALDLGEDEVAELVNMLDTEYAKEIRGIYIRRVAGGLQLATKPVMLSTIQKLVNQQEMKLSNAALETLAIIAFKQPVTRSEMEAICGVKRDGVVNNLLELALIEEVGRKDVIGHPILYGTTDLFLTVFGLNTLHDLPEIPEEILAPKTDEVQEGALFSSEGKVLTEHITEQKMQIEANTNTVENELPLPKDTVEAVTENKDNDN